MGRRVTLVEISNHLRARRIARNMSQIDLADACGITRQAIGAIETGQYVPNTAVALRLAEALGGTVEDIFSIPREPVRVEASLLKDVAIPTDEPVRVQVGRVGDRLVAVPLRGSVAAFMAADGLIVDDHPVRPSRARTERSVEVDLFVDRALVDQAVVVHGCDPSLALLGAHVARRYPTFRLLWVHHSSIEALRALARGEGHVAGTHLCDPITGVCNVPYVQRELVGRHLVLITLSEWQQGLIVATGNPKGITGPADLGRPDVTMVNREQGSGSRLLLDAWLSRAGLSPSTVRGYGREATTHMDVGEAVARGAADAGPGLLAVARLLGLAFLPIQRERYDLVVPKEYLGHPPLQALLDVAVSAQFRRELGAMGGYDSTQTGTVVVELAS